MTEICCRSCRASLPGVCRERKCQCHRGRDKPDTPSHSDPVWREVLGNITREEERKKRKRKP
jgi:hypothetical protein